MILSPLHYSVVCYGEILWDILPEKALPGGAPMNVAYHLKKLGVDPVLLSRVGEDERGEMLISLLAKSGLPTEFVQVDEGQQTGVVYAHLKESNEITYDIVQPVAWDFIEWRDAFTELLAGAEFFVYGSLTSRSPRSRSTLHQLLDAAKTKVLDINLRPPHYKREDLEFLLHKADQLKMNSAELSLIAGWFSDLPQDDDKMKLLQDRFHIPAIIVTRGEQGAVLLEEGSLHRHRGYRVQVADTIGSGDAFLAGFLQQRMCGASPEQALTYASGLGALVASYAGACPAYQPSEVRALITAQSINDVSTIYNH